MRTCFAARNRLLVCFIATIACAACGPLSQPGLSLPAAGELQPVNQDEQREARRSSGVITSLDVASINGYWHVTFTATPNRDSAFGSWTVAAHIDPIAVSFQELCLDGCINPCTWEMRGTANGSTVAIPGTPAVLQATGCHEHGHGGCAGNTPVTLECAFTLDSAGIVLEAGLTIE